MAVAIFFGFSSLVVIVSTSYLVWAIRGHLKLAVKKAEGQDARR